jgi:hypothetical protein
MKITRPARFAGVLGLLALAGLAAAPALATGPQLVILSGTQAPGMAPDVVFEFFSDPRLTSDGQIAFWAELAGPGITEANAGSVWKVGGRAGFTLVRRQGDPSPVAGFHLAALPSFSFNNLGEYAFTASLVETASPIHPTRLGTFLHDTSGITPLAVEDEPATGLPGVDWSGLPLPQLAAFQGASATGFSASNGQGMWRYAEGLLSLRHAAGEPAPGSTLEFAFLDQPTLGGRGDVVFRSTLAAAGTSDPVSSGLYLAVAATTEQLAAEGDDAPGTPMGTTFAEFTAQPAAALGNAAFWARLDGPGITADNNSGIWHREGVPPTLGVLARAGEPAPGTEPGVLFASFGRQVLMSPSGTIAFMGYLTGPGVSADNNAGIWVRPAGGSLSLLVRKGDAAPGLPAGTELAMLGPLFMSEDGHIAFTSYLSGSAVTPQDNFALFATDLESDVIPIIRKGDQLDVGGTMQAVAEIIFDSGTPGSGQAQIATVDGRGTLIYKVRFVTTPPAVLQALYTSTIVAPCYANCDGSTTEPVLNVEDFVCFVAEFATGLALPPEHQITHYANCDGSTAHPVLNVEDFVCFVAAFASGCP